MILRYQKSLLRIASPKLSYFDTRSAIETIRYLPRSTGSSFGLPPMITGTDLFNRSSINRSVQGFQVNGKSAEH